MKIFKIVISENDNIYLLQYVYAYYIEQVSPGWEPKRKGRRGLKNGTWKNSLQSTAWNSKGLEPGEEKATIKKKKKITKFQKMLKKTF